MEKTVVQNNNKYAIVINVYQCLFSLLNQTVNHCRQNCGRVSYGWMMWHTFIIWCDVDKIPSLSDAFWLKHYDNSNIVKVTVAQSPKS